MFRISFISSLEIVNAILPDPNIILWIATSLADGAAVNANDIKTLLATINLWLKATQFLVTILKIYLKIFLIVLFYANEFLIILY